MYTRKKKENYGLAGSIKNVHGIIESFTAVYNAPSGFEKHVPYILALIALDNGEKVTAQVVDSKNIVIGMKVEPCLRKMYVDGDEGIIHYGTKFRLVK